MNEKYSENLKTITRFHLSMDRDMEIQGFNKELYIFLLVIKSISNRMIFKFDLQKIFYN